MTVIFNPFNHKVPTNPASFSAVARNPGSIAPAKEPKVKPATRAATAQ
jgi:hypothetical protein